MPKRQRSNGINLRTIHKWVGETKKRTHTIRKQKTEEEDFHVNITYTGSYTTTDSEGEGSFSEPGRSSGVESTEPELESDGGSSPFRFLRGYLSDENKRIPSGDFNFNNIYNLPTDNFGDGTSSEEVDGHEATISLGRNNDTEPSDTDETVPTHEEIYEEGLMELGRTMAAKFVSGIHRYVSRIIVPDGIGGISQCLRELDFLITKYPPAHYYIVSEHNDHIHVSHICPYSANSCRCSFLVRGTFWVKNGRRGLRRISRAIDLGPIDWRDILRYLSTGGRRLHCIGGFREDERLFDRYKHLSAQRYMGQTEGGLLAGCDGEMSWDVPCRPQSRSLHIEDNKNVRGKNERSKKYKKNTQDTGVRAENGPLTITELLYKFPCTTPDAYKNIKEYYMNANLNYLCANDKYVTRDIDLWTIKLMHWSLKDYSNYYKDETVHPYFNAYNRSFDHVYFDVNESLRIANELLMYQFDNNSENVFYFLTDLLNILDKRVPK
ncbi:uncharacterized protein LOC132935693 [Metopolophium dirhodum]|uniref:uncharacterized protein LOC132935693 n=1 Tax=Metopolophium dirhodum TaxID=44670 RepID=UPI00298FBB95|nr:uncharacterized protein LOC132935693 [Metopolophium dirhodum]